MISQTLNKDTCEISHFDSTLGLKLKTGNSGAVFNPRFNGRAYNIQLNLKSRTPMNGNRYENGEDKELLETSREHAKTYARLINAEQVLMITHPLYMHLSHMDKIKNFKIMKEATLYKENLFNVLEANKSKRKLNVIFLETVHHYAAATSLLLETGLIDRVIFTEYDEGIPLEKNELMVLKDRKLFFGGGYNSLCLNDSLTSLQNLIDVRNESFAVRDLIIKSPRDEFETLIPDSIFINESKMPIERVISLEDFMQITGLN